MAKRLAAAAALLGAVAARPIRVILDTDIGTDMDDAFALTLILSRPDVYDLRLVQTSTYNTTKRSQIVAGMLTQAGRTDIPIGVGRYTGEQGYPQYNQSLPSLEAYAAGGGIVVNGTQLMANIMRTSTPEDPVLIVEIAPPTSLGDVLGAEPALANNCLCVAMSGSIYRGYDNSSTPSAEYNVKEDILSAQRVYNASWLMPLVTAPLDTTVFAQLNGPVWQYFLTAANTSTPDVHPLARMILGQYEIWYANGGDHYNAIVPFNPTNSTSTLYDLFAAYMGGAFAGWRAPAPGGALGASALPHFPWMTTQLLNVAVDATGHTVITPTGQPVAPAVAFPDGASVDVPQIGLDVLSSMIAGGA